jgi:Ca2+-binding RTX toxin-like protein
VRFQNVGGRTFGATPMDTAELQPNPSLVVSEADVTITNAEQLTGSPAVLVSGDRATFVNLPGGSISLAAGSGTDLSRAAVVITGAGVVLENRSGASISADDGTYQAVLGSAYADTVINEGSIRGYVRLGDGADRYRELAGESNGFGDRYVDLGDGNDEAVFDLSEATSTINISAAGGAGTDLLRFENVGNGDVIRFNGVTSFETIEFSGAGPNSSAIFNRWAPAYETILVNGGLNLVFSASSSASYTGLASGTVIVNDATLRLQRNTVPDRIIGGEGSEHIVLEPQIVVPNPLPTAINSVALGGGDDSFTWHYGYRSPLIADGGEGNDLLVVSQVYAEQSLAAFTGFERVHHQLATDSTSGFTLRDLGIDVQQLILNANESWRASTLTLDLGVRSGLTVGAGFSPVLIAQGTTVGSVMDRVLVDESRTSSGQQIENRGTVAGDVVLEGGDDRFVNAGAIGGAISLGDGNDSFADTASSSFRGVVSGGAGNDTYIVIAGYNPTEAINEGTDTVLSEISFVLGANIENLTLTGNLISEGTGNAGANTITGNSSVNVLYGLGGNDLLFGEAGDDSLFGGDGDDFLYGGAGRDVLEGGTGNDSLFGGAGNDQMAGGSGNDTYEVDSEGDVVFEAAAQGTDLVTASVNYTLHDNVEFLNITGNVVFGFGNGLANTINGNAAGNRLAGFGGDDRLSGQAGNDVLDGGEGNDVLLGGTGADTLVGGAGDDIYEVDDTGDLVWEAAGNGVTDNVFAYVDFALPDEVENLIMLYGNQRFGTGNAGHNIVIGNASDNVMEGGAGYDTLTGGAGSDLFVVRAGFGVDVITDFQAGTGSEDAILFSTSLFSSFAQVMSHSRQVGSDTWIEVGQGNTVVLTGVSLSSLAADDFGFL